MSFCPNCGTQVDDGAAFCPSCGSALGAAAPVAATPAAPGTFEMIFGIYKKAILVCLKKPIKLWALSLLEVLMTVQTYALCGIIPAAALAITFVLSLGMTWVFLDGYRGEDVSAEQLFEGFKNFWHSFAGMGWKTLLMFLWGLIPLCGWVFSIIKGYGYSLVPYIIRESPETSAVAVAKESLRRTKGFKGKMFLTDVLMYVLIWVAIGILILLCKIPVLGKLFLLILIVFILAVAALLPLFKGLVKAAWYEEITKANGTDVQ